MKEDEGFRISCFLYWEYEDNLPEMSDEVYKGLFLNSQIWDGVRMFPYIIHRENKLYLWESSK